MEVSEFVFVSDACRAVTFTVKAGHLSSILWFPHSAFQIPNSKPSVICLQVVGFRIPHSEFRIQISVNN